VKNVLKALNQKPIGYYPIYHKITNSIHGGILLSQLMYWFSKKDKFHKKNEDLMAELGFSERELRTAKTALKKATFIVTTREGNPSKNFYSIDWESYFVFIKNSVDSVTTSNDDSVNSSNDETVTTRHDETVTTLNNENLLTKTTTKTTTKNKKITKKENAFRILLANIRAEISHKSKVDFTKKAFEIYKNSDLSDEEIQAKYLAYYSLKKEYTPVMAKFLTDYEGVCEELGRGGRTNNYNQPEKGSIDHMLQQQANESQFIDTEEL